MDREVTLMLRFRSVAEMERWQDDACCAGLMDRWHPADEAANLGETTEARYEGDWYLCERKDDGEENA